MITELERELQALQYLAQGKQNAAIAQEMDLSVETVKSHVSSVLEKLQASSRTEAVAIAFRESLVN